MYKWSNFILSSGHSNENKAKQKLNWGNIIPAMNSQSTVCTYAYTKMCILYFSDAAWLPQFMNCFPQYVKKEYSKEWEFYKNFPMQFLENHDFIDVQICQREPETEDADKWKILPLLKTEDKVEVMIVVTPPCTPSESTS